VDRAFAQPDLSAGFKIGGNSRLWLAVAFDRRGDT
jgi:hypothetical protein